MNQNNQNARPKRRRSKDNPYTLIQEGQQCFVSFTDGNGTLHKLRITQAQYDVFNESELVDLSHLNEQDRHIERSLLSDVAIYHRSLDRPDTVDELALGSFRTEQLYEAIATLTQTQRRRLSLYFFEGYTLEEIAEMEGCSKVAVKYSLDQAKEKIKKFFEKA